MIIKAISFFKNAVTDVLKYLNVKSKYKFPKVLSIEDTLTIIIENKISFARYGDAEFNHIQHIGIGYQEGTVELSNRLQEILISKQEHCLVCIPGSLDNLGGMVWRSQLMWMHLIAKYYPNYHHLLKSNTAFPNSLITRPYMDLSNKQRSVGLFTSLKKIWQDRDILIVEGEHTKLGIGNDLFAKAKSIERIITVSKNAFTKYDLIIDAIKKSGKDKLILIALGATATVLAYDLSKEGFQASDVGHIDIEYEWFLKKTKKKIAVDGKFVNELSTDDPVTTLINEDYQSQVIKSIL
jgi:glycosyltransferase family protein